MSRFDTKPEDWERVEEKEKQLVDSTSMFIAKRLRDDLDKIQVVFLQIPEMGVVYYDGKPENKGQANVASFVNDQFEGVFLLEMAPKHMLRFRLKLQKPNYGLPKIYEIERHGVRDNKQTLYDLEYVRDLTPAERAVLETVDLYDLFKRQDGDAAPSPAPRPPTPAQATLDEGYVEWNKAVAAEAKRLGWADEGKLGENIKLAITRFLGGYLHGSEMTEHQRDGFLDMLRGLHDGTAPASVEKWDIAGGIDLDEDVDFF